LEDYLLYPIDPAPTIAARVKGWLAELGVDLFRKVFEGNRDTTRLWDVVSDRLADTRIEVVTTVEDATAVPWELLRDPATDAMLAVHSRAFVRADPQAPRSPILPEAAETARVLLVICRPRGREDVPFRSVASHLVRLSRTARERCSWMCCAHPPSRSSGACWRRPTGRAGRITWCTSTATAPTWARKSSRQWRVGG
jgi:hypothetical protein